MQGVLKWQGLAALGSTLALAAGLAALTPGAIAAPVTHACGSHVVVIEQEVEPGKPPSKFKLTVKQITAQGLSCPAAFKAINAIYNNRTGKPFEGYKCAVIRVKAVPGLVPEQCSKSGKKIRFAGPGG